MVEPEKAAPVTRITLRTIGPVLVDSGQKRHRYAIVCGPVNSGLARWLFTVYVDAVAECGRNPVSKRHIQPECGDEQVVEGRDCRTRLARLNSQARTVEM